MKFSNFAFGRVSSSLCQENLPLNNLASISNLQSKTSLPTYFDVIQKLHVKQNMNKFIPSSLHPITVTSTSTLQKKPFAYFKSAQTGVTGLHDDASRRIAILGHRPLDKNNHVNAPVTSSNKPVEVVNPLKRKVGRPRIQRTPINPSEAVKKIFRALNKENLLSEYRERHTKTVAQRKVSFLKRRIQIRYSKSRFPFSSKISHNNTIALQKENVNCISSSVNLSYSETEEEYSGIGKRLELDTLERTCDDDDNFKIGHSDPMDVSRSVSMETPTVTSERKRLITTLRRLSGCHQKDVWAVVHSTLEDVLQYKIATIMNKPFQKPLKKLRNLSEIKIETNDLPSSSTSMCLYPVLLFPIDLNKINSFAIVPFTNYGDDLRKETDDWKISGILFTPKIRKERSKNLQF